MDKGKIDPGIFKDIIRARASMGEFTLGYVMEAILGEKFANQIRDEVGSLYDMKIKDIDAKSTYKADEEGFIRVENIPNEDGRMRTRVFMDTKPDTPERRKELIEMIDRQTENLNRIANSKLDI